MTITDAVESTKTLLTSNWTASNTDNATPKIDAVFNVKRVAGMTEKDDVVLVYEGKTVQETNALGGKTRLTKTPVTIDIRSVKTRARAIKLIKEVDRICGTKIVNPDSNYDILDPDNGWMDLSDKTIGLWRFIYEIFLVKLNESRI